MIDSTNSVVTLTQKQQKVVLEQATTLTRIADAVEALVDAGPGGGGGGGDASAAKQDTGNASLASIDGKIPASPATSGKQDTGNTSLGSIDTKLSSQATAAKQDTSNTALASIDTKTPALSGGKVPILMDQPGLATTAKQDTAQTSLSSIDSKLPASPATSGKQDTGNASLWSIDGKIPASPSTAGNQTTGNTSLSSIDTKLSSQATAAKQDTGNTSIASVDTKLGEVQTTPTPNTVLDRLKAIVTGITGLLTGIILAAGENFIGAVGGRAATIIGSVGALGGATPYSVGDLIGDSGTPASVTRMALAVARANDKSAILRRVRLKVNDAAWTTAGATVRCHFYKDDTGLTLANGDNGAWSTTENTYLGAVDVTFDKAFTDPFSKGIGVPNTGSEIIFEPKAGSQNIYCLLEARTSVTAASNKTFTLTAEVLQN